MQVQNKKYVLAIAYNNYQTGIGGVDRAVIAQKEKLCRAQISYVFVFPQLARIKRRYVLAHLWEVIADDKNYGLYTTRELVKELLELQREHYRLQSVTIHHLLNLYFPDLYFLLDGMTGTIQVMIHDYYTVCPQCFLLKNNEKFCGEDGYREEKCRNCRNYPDVENHVQRMKEFFYRYLGRMQLIFPSEHAKQLWSKAYPEIGIVKKVVPHLMLCGEYLGNMEEIAEERPIKIAYIGQQLYLKGWDIWKQLYLDKKFENGYRSYYIGMGKDTGSSDTVVRVSFQKDGRDGMQKMLRKRKIDCAILWSICPETYSYVYYECLAANLFVITNVDSGNIAAMVRENGNGEVLNCICELEELIGTPFLLKEKINRWRAEKKFGAKILFDNRILFEIGHPEAAIVERWDDLAESELGKIGRKILVQFVKQVKKIFIKWFY